MRFRRFTAVGTATAALVLGVAPALGQQPAGTTTRPEARLATPLFSLRRIPDVVRAPVADANLRRELGDLLATAPPDSCLSVTVAGRAAVRINADHPLEPASVNKLLTADAILRQAPADEPVSTVVVAAKPAVDGVVDGHVWLVGGGDGLLTTAGYQAAFRDQQQTAVDIGRLAAELRAKGIAEIRGDVIADESRYDNVRDVATWPPRYRAQEAVGPLSAMTINDGVTGYEADPEKPSKVRKPGDPPMLSAATFKSLLEDHGIRVTGKPSVGWAPEGAVKLAQLDSTIGAQVSEMLNWSDNTTAELLNKEAGRRAVGLGTTANGVQATNEALRADRFPTAGLVLIDGSGLDGGNRLTCDLLTALLDHHGLRSTIGQSLAIAGQRGTLRPRMRQTELEGKVFAKTGTLQTVASLAGFVTTGQGTQLTFSFIQNGPKVDVGLQDKVAAALYRYPQAPDVQDLVPRSRAEATG